MGSFPYRSKYKSRSYRIARDCIACGDTFFVPRERTPVQYCLKCSKLTFKERQLRRLENDRKK